MAPRIIEFIQKIFRRHWKGKIKYNRKKSRQSRSTCVLKSVSSKSSLSLESAYSSPNQAYSIESINFEFGGEEDLCCLRKCCEKCFCEEGESLADNLRKRKRKRAKTKNLNKPDHCHCISRCSIAASRGSMDSACDVSSTSSCQETYCEYREAEPQPQGLPVETFASIQAVASVGTDYGTIPPYENIITPKAESSSQEPLYDSVPLRPPRAISADHNYENVLSINCVDDCVFREISSLIDKMQNREQAVESLQELHKEFSCLRRSSSADNEINYYYENYEELENDLNEELELERRLSD